MNNVSMCKKVPKVVETQQKLKCGKHAINNLLQKKNFATCEALNNVSKLLSQLYDIKLNELVNPSGYYDTSVLITFLMNHNFNVIHLTSSKAINSKTNIKKLIGYILGDGNHWFCIRKEKSFTQKRYCYFVIDSLHKTSFKINLKPWITNFYKNVNRNNILILQVNEP